MRQFVDRDAPSFHDKTSRKIREAAGCFLRGKTPRYFAVGIPLIINVFTHAQHLWRVSAEAVFYRTACGPMNLEEYRNPRQSGNLLIWSLTIWKYPQGLVCVRLLLFSSSFRYHASSDRTITLSPSIPYFWKFRLAWLSVQSSLTLHIGL